MFEKVVNNVCRRLQMSDDALEPTVHIRYVEDK
jgi:hypothetical protein